MTTSSRLLFNARWYYPVLAVLFGAARPEQAFSGFSSPSWFLVLGVFGSGLAYIAYYDALQALPASQLGVFLNIEPLVTTLLAAAMIGEAITIVTLLGGAIILLGVYLVNRRQG